MPRLALLSLAVALAAAVTSGAPAAQTRRARVLDTVIGQGGAEVRLPPSADNLGNTLASIAKATGALIGFETVMDEEPSAGRDHFGWSLQGLTVAQALDQVAALDVRYEWREHDGVIHFRPKTAFADCGHFLNRRVPRFELKDVIPLHATFEVHRVFRPDCDVRHPIFGSGREKFLSQELPAMRQPITVALTNVTVLEILDAVVKAHGALAWNLTFRVPPHSPKPESALYEHAIFSFHDRPAVGGWWRMCRGDEVRDPE